MEIQFTTSFLHTCLCMAPREIFKYPHYVFVWYTSRVAPHVIIPCVVVSRMVIPCVPFYTRPSMIITEFSAQVVIMHI